MKIDKLVAIERRSNSGSVVEGLGTNGQGIDVLEWRIETLEESRCSLEENLSKIRFEFRSILDGILPVDLEPQHKVDS